MVLKARYIRTKQGLVLDTKRCLDCDEHQGLLRFAKEHQKGGKQITIAVKNIIAQADKIEELCDHLVVLQNAKKVHNGTFMLTEDNLPHEYWVNRAKEYYCHSFYYVFLGIWTLEGLKFVAKMNKTGEWKLL